MKIHKYEADLSESERLVSEALHLLRQVTSQMADDDAVRISLYLDSIEVEMERIKKSR